MRAPITVAELPVTRNMSQAELASAVGISQATISRLENNESSATLQTLARIAHVFERDLRDQGPAGRLQELSGAFMGEDFYAFCPNPFCNTNETGFSNGSPTIRWSSGRSYRSELFDETNFCPSCGTALVKQCPSCERELEKGATYCIACGKKISDRPTSDEWEKIREMYQSEHGKFDDDIPFCELYGVCPDLLWWCVELRVEQLWDSSSMTSRTSPLLVWVQLYTLSAV